MAGKTNLIDKRFLNRVKKAKKRAEKLHIKYIEDFPGSYATAEDKLKDTEIFLDWIENNEARAEKFK